MNILLTLSLLGVITLFSEIFNFRKIIFPIIIAGLVGAGALCVINWNTNEVLYNMSTIDNYSLAFTFLLVFITTCWFLLSYSYFKNENSIVDKYSLILFSLTGAFVMTSYTNLSMLFIGIEMLSIPLYVLAGSNKSDRVSSEAAFKYFLMGAFATGFLLFGIAFIYGSTGTFDLLKLNQIIVSNGGRVPNILLSGIILMFVGLCFKIAAVPFHFWAPDVYQGSPTIVTAFMATIIKTAAIAAFYRLFKIGFLGLNSSIETIILIVIAISLILGNFLAVYQTNVKRLLAYSSISHAGFMLIGILIVKQMNSASVMLYYTSAYAIASLITFFILQIISKGGEDIGSFNGLISRNPLLSVIMTVALLSLAGIPPFSGFFGKYFMFVGAITDGYLWIIILAVLASLVGVVYYFKIIIAIFAKPSIDNQEITVSGVQSTVLVFLAILLLMMGILPGWIVGLI